MSRPPVLTCAAAGCTRQFRVPVANLDERGCSDHRGAVPPVPVAPDPLPAWAALGACVGLPPGPWDGDDPEDTAAAVRVCHAECPVRLECGTWARAAGAWGVWGGERLVDGRPTRHARRVA